MVRGRNGLRLAPPPVAVSRAPQNTLSVYAGTPNGEVLRGARRLRTGEGKENGMTITERVADMERTLDALLSGGSGWPPGLIDIAVKRLETSIEVLQMSEQELAEMSTRYQEIANRTLGPTSAALMIEVARRSTLTGHERMAEAAERARQR
jgi:hypothetical protein